MPPLARTTNPGVPLARIVERFELEVLTDGGVDLETRRVHEAKVNRPGLQWAGYSEHFPADRLQLIGRGEAGYLASLPPEVAQARLEQYAQLDPLGVILAHGLGTTDSMIDLARRYAIPLLRTPMPTTQLATRLRWYLAMELAPRAVLHAGLVDVAGEGVLILGPSGIGKSETALELIRRGHRLIADDTVEVRRPTEHDLIGIAPARMRYLMEVKGIGIVNLRQMYGVGSVKASGDLSLVIQLQRPDPQAAAPPRSEMELLGVMLPLVTIPVHPGRGAAILIESAAMDIRAGRLGNPLASGIESRADLLERL